MTDDIGMADVTWPTVVREDIRWELIVVETGCLWCGLTSVHIHRCNPDGTVVLIPERGEAPA